jgi:hypothetical protein
MLVRPVNAMAIILPGGAQAIEVRATEVLGVPRLLTLVAFAPPAIMPTPARVPAETNASRRESGIHVRRVIDLRRVCSAGACQPAKNHIHQAENNRSYESCPEAIHAKAFDDGGR